MLQIQNNPWLGLASYQVQDADLFFGREKEMAVLCDVIKQNYSTVIYGKSGMGKTSLINAGLIPLLSADGFLPVSIKLEHNGKRSYADQIIEAVTQKLEEQGGEMEGADGLEGVLPEECKLWTFFHTRIFWSKDNHRVVPVVFIDQFEEMFTICESKTDVQNFFALLNDLFQSLPPDDVLKLMDEKGIRMDFSESTNFRLILSLREDFLARLEDYSYNIPVLRKNRVGVSPLSGLQAMDVILKPVPGIMDRKAALKILEKVSKCPDIVDDEDVQGNLSVETCILSLFCSQLYKKAVDLKKDTITSELIEQLGDNIINDYYQECMRRISKDSVTFLEDRLLTSSGYRNSLAYEDVVPQYVQKEEIDYLEKCRLIRIEILNKTERIEFTHDVLCGVALEHKTQRRLSKERRGKVSVVAGCVVEISMMLYYLLMLFVGMEDPFRQLFRPEPYASDMALATGLLGVTMLMRLYMYATDRRSAWFSIVAFVLGNVGSSAAAVTLEAVSCREVWWIPWLLLFTVYNLVSFVFSFTKARKGSFIRLLKSTFGGKEGEACYRIAVKAAVVLGYLLLAVVSGLYMRRPLTVAMLLGLVPVLLLAASIWKSALLTNKQVWGAGVVIMAFLVCLYCTQYSYLRWLTFALAALLGVSTYWGIGYVAVFRHRMARVAWALAVWLVAFIMLPTLVMGYNVWGLGEYTLVKDGLIVSMDDKVKNRYVVLENRLGRQGAFDRKLSTLIPARYEYVGSEAKMGANYVKDQSVADICFPVNRYDSAFISQYLMYENPFSQSLLQAYSRYVRMNVLDMIEEAATPSEESSEYNHNSGGASAAFASHNEYGKALRLERLYEDGEIMFVLNPDIYMTMAEYYHSKDSVGLETTMLFKALQYSIAADSTLRFLQKGNWASTPKEVVSSLASAAIYVAAGHWYSGYVARYDSCFLSDMPYQEFVRQCVIEPDGETFMAKVADSGLYDSDVMSAISKDKKLISIRNEDFNRYIRRAYERLGDKINESFALLFMGDYAEAREAALEAMTDSTRRLLASTNLVSSYLFLGEYDEAYELLDANKDSIIFNGAFKFYRDWVLQDLKEFERVGIVRDIPRKEYLRFRRYIDPAGDRTYGTLAKCSQYGVNWAAVSPQTTLWMWWFPFGLNNEGSIYLMDEHGERLTPDFDDVYIARYTWDYVTDEWGSDPIAIYSTGGKRGFYNIAARRYVTGAVYDHAWIFSEGVAAVAKDGKVGFIDETGATVIPFRYEYIPGYDYVFEDGYARIYGHNGKVGLIDRQGNVVVPVEYDNIGDWQDGYRVVRKGSEEYIMDETGSLLEYAH